MNKLLTILFLFLSTASLSYALKMDGAEILKHKLIISGSDNKVHVIDGHVESAEKSEPSEKALASPDKQT